MQSSYRRAFMGLRYETLITKNQRILSQKNQLELTERAYSGWKYQITLDKALREFQDLKYKQEINNVFCTWFNLYKLESTRKRVMKKYLIRKDNEDKTSAL